MNKPSMLQFETIFGCNARCIMCGCIDSKREKGKMKLTLIKKIIREATEMGIKEFAPFINGEPLLDSRMLNILSYIKEINPEANIGWYTNGALLTEKIIKTMIDIGNIKVFNISIHGGNKETYEKVMSLNWEKTLEKLNLLCKINTEMGKPFKINAIFTSFSETQNSIPEFKKICSDLNVEPHICVFSNFAGGKKDEAGENSFKNAPYKLCARSQNHMYILKNGQATNCCFNVEGTLDFGNAKDMTLQEIWNSEKYKQFRQLHREGRYQEIDACKNCNSCKFGG
jgi:MoaA/NifB/PqqE/SkfB family radical SAM enzyme